MKNISEILLSPKDTTEILMGNYALVRAFIETGTKVVTSYPGSPTVEIAEAIKSIPTNQRPFYFEFSTNEKIAMEVSLGAALNGNLSAVFCKSVGLNVAADTFVQLSLMNITGGMVVILGDDPGANSSQNEQDNRHYSKMRYVPVLEPSTPKEAFKFYKESAIIASKFQMPVILRLTTHVCHAKEMIKFSKLNSVSKNNFYTNYNKNNGPYIPLQSNVAKMKSQALKKLDKISLLADKSNFNKVVNNNSSKGIITQGLPFLSLQEILENKSNNKPDILKLAYINPIPKDTILQFIKTHKEIKIIEELDDILEKEIKSLAFDNDIKVNIKGKGKIEDWIGEYTPGKVHNIIYSTWPDIIPKPEKQENKNKAHIAERVPQMCPGCGHRSAFYAIKKSLKKEDITIADIGCHTLGTLPPYNMGSILICMGASLGLGCGLSSFNHYRRVISFIGDSTFYHAGMSGTINALFNKHNFTLIIMENETTAMTGHQDHPGSGQNFDGKTEKISIKNILESFGIKNIFKADTYQQNKLKEAVEAANNTNEFAVVIAKHKCMLKFVRESREKGINASPVEIDQSLCKKSYDCVRDFACPSISLNPNGKIEINEELCIGDGSCIQTCPYHAIKKKK